LSTDIFDFWAQIKDDACVHPADAPVLDRLGSQHKFALDCLPIGFFGPLRTAKVVLLFLSPGLSPIDPVHPHTVEGRAYYRSQRDGRGRLPSEVDHLPAYKWWVRVVRQFHPEPEVLADRIAILNIGAYHSTKFHDWHTLAALPSSRVALDHAQQVLFPEAEAGSRVVVCLRSARYWGLSRPRRYDQSLFAPPCTPGGMMHHGDLRTSTIAAVRSALA
jgi:hypothetical protein